MIVVIKPETSEQAVEEICTEMEGLGYSIHRSVGENRTVLGVIGHPREEVRANLEAKIEVEKVVPISKPFKLASREFHPHDTVIPLGENGLKIGGEQLIIMAGPCAVEGEEQLLESARQVKEAGANVLRGGAFKPRTSPYSFQGMEKEGLRLLSKVRETTGLLVVSEVVDPVNVELVQEYVDILQVGTRNMQNFYLLKELAKIDKPVMLKRGMSATIEEWLMAAEYIISGGNEKVILCERGIRTFETYTRNTLDISAIAVVKELSHLPVVVDPSHGTGRKQAISPMCMASVAAGADGLMIEVHPQPEKALSDGPQSFNPEEFKSVMGRLKEVAPVVGKRL